MITPARPLPNSPHLSIGEDSRTKEVLQERLNGVTPSGTDGMVGPGHAPFCLGIPAWDQTLVCCLAQLCQLTASAEEESRWVWPGQGRYWQVVPSFSPGPKFTMPLGGWRKTEGPGPCPRALGSSRHLVAAGGRELLGTVDTQEPGRAGRIHLDRCETG